jgi:hypothetical protein
VESLEALFGTDVSLKCSSTVDENAYPTFYNSLCTDHMPVNLKLMRMNVDALE